MTVPTIGGPPPGLDGLAGRLAAAARAGDDAPAHERMLRVALAYAALGLRIMPVWHVLADGVCACGDDTHAPGRPGEKDAGKHPRVRRGVGEATGDPRIIRAWWGGWPHAGIAIATGHLVDVVDIDSADALRTVADLAAAGRIPGPIATARTGRPGGVHWIIPASGAGNAQGHGPFAGIDYRGVGGYIIAAPTVHRTGRAYTWVGGDDLTLPAGDPARGAAIPGPLPWERTARPGISRRERAYAAGMLTRQVARVAAAADRHAALVGAGRALGAVVAAGWINRGEVTRALTGAYAAAGGTRPDDAAQTLARAVAAGTRHPLPDLPDREPKDVATVITAIRGWMADPASWPHLRGARRTVLDWLLGRVEAQGSVVVRAAVRDVEVGAGVSHGAAVRSLGGLAEAGVLRRLAAGSRRSGEATVWCVQAPKVNVPTWTTDVVIRRTPVGGVVHVGTLSHAVWSPRRGYGAGMTHTDHRLLAAMPLDGAEISITAWAASAAIGRRTAYRASDPTVPGSLAALGLVERAGRGVVRATAAGRLAAEEARGSAATTGTLDRLAADLAVASRAEERAARVATEREAHARGLLGRIIADALHGRPCRPRDLPRARRLLPGSAYEALRRLLARLDETAGSRPVRAAVARAVGAVAAGQTADADDRDVILTWAGVIASPLDRVLDGDWAPAAEIIMVAEVGVGLRVAIAGPLVDEETGEIRDVTDPVTWGVEVHLAAGLVDPLPAVTISAPVTGRGVTRASGQPRPARAEAMDESGATGIRSILMVGAMLLFAISHGFGASQRMPIAALLGGLLPSILLALLVVPALFTVFDALRGRRLQRRPWVADPSTPPRIPGLPAGWTCTTPPTARRSGRTAAGRSLAQPDTARGPRRRPVVPVRPPAAAGGCRRPAGVAGSPPRRLIVRGDGRRQPAPVGATPPSKRSASVGSSPGVRGDGHRSSGRRRGRPPADAPG